MISSPSLPTDKAHLLLLAAQINWANDHQCRWITDQFLDPTHPELIRQLQKYGYEDDKEFLRILESFGLLSELELLQIVTALLEAPPF